jgi:hypothetical protein
MTCYQNYTSYNTALKAFVSFFSQCFFSPFLSLSIEIIHDFKNALRAFIESYESESYFFKYNNEYNK